ncbi:hypothetical protein PHSY_004728 [Pseudozyma hubeiensis SY62]|uniref:Uncharacterized protein n=1 Tax=Pseudozyma hubeiensis (strain SY62) TaxID=1305764 RepID=R9P6W2_PSEHS|nr:hypothetical protein PHSY_004728 [Pseudozyma hubeiensis SY62]GAC97143.1 hypothetical protein PHSY_004728 [Pseudozyma hubeiensis SY62]
MSPMANSDVSSQLPNVVWDLLAAYTVSGRLASSYKKFILRCRSFRNETSSGLVNPLRRFDLEQGISSVSHSSRRHKEASCRIHRTLCMRMLWCGTAIKIGVSSSTAMCLPRMDECRSVPDFRFVVFRFRNGCWCLEECTVCAVCYSIQRCLEAARKLFSNQRERVSKSLPKPV